VPDHASRGRLGLLRRRPRAIGTFAKRLFFIVAEYVGAIEVLGKLGEQPPLDSCSKPPEAIVGVPMTTYRPCWGAWGLVPRTRMPAPAAPLPRG
jgi:hypothetical protein